MPFNRLNLHVYNAGSLSEGPITTELQTALSKLSTQLVLIDELYRPKGQVIAPALKALQDHPQDHQLELDFVFVAVLMDVLQRAKNVSYHNSYSKRGLLSAFFNIERKFERFDAQLFGGTQDAHSEGFIDTLGDLAIYCVKTFAWYALREPELFRKWLEAVLNESTSSGMVQLPPEDNGEDADDTV